MHFPYCFKTIVVNLSFLVFWLLVLCSICSCVWSWETSMQSWPLSWRLWAVHLWDVYTRQKRWGTEDRQVFTSASLVFRELFSFCFVCFSCSARGPTCDLIEVFTFLFSFQALLPWASGSGDYALAQEITRAVSVLFILNKSCYLYVSEVLFFVLVFFFFLILFQ